MTTIVDTIESRAVRKDRPRFAAGDRVRVHFLVVEGGRTRTQVFEGIVIKRQGSGARETFTVRKQSFGVGVERTFPLHSPKIEKLEVAARGEVRRAKLYYLREKVGKQARVAERRWGIADDVLGTGEEAEAVDAEGVGLEEAEPEVNPEAEVPGDSAEGESGEDAAEGGDEQKTEEDSEQPKAEAPEESGGEGGEPEEQQDEQPGAEQVTPEPPSQEESSAGEDAGDAGDSEGADAGDGAGDDPDEDEG